MDRRDPVEARSEGELDLYDVATWEPRTALDRLATSVYGGLLAVTRAVVITLAVLILATQIVLGGIGAVLVQDPAVVTLVLLSLLPALLLAGYVYLTDITTSEPLDLLVGTFVLGVLFASFAAVVNSLFSPVLRGLPGILGLWGMIVFFYLVVGPVEESVKWLAVRLYAFRDTRFNAVIDGAVYGATAGLGFATIENALYITQFIAEGGQTVAVGLPTAGIGIHSIAGLVGIGGVLAQAGAADGIVVAGSRITALRALAGPGHVIYSAFAGYYLGLAKFNPTRAGPIAVKGLLIAAFIHGTYNVLVSLIPPIVSVLVPGVSSFAVFIGFVLVYDGLFGYVLVRKLGKYRRAYKAVHDREEREAARASGRLPEKTEFDA